LIATNRADLFWKSHSKNKAENFYSESFKDLITNMLQTMANQRLSMADIIGHPWMLGKIADASQVRQEFANRNQQIKET
jgi:CRISPR/Cas system-associated endonuclease Cas3-HD